MTILTYRDWETEMLNRLEFGHSNELVEGLKNLTKVMKGDAFGVRALRFVLGRGSSPFTPLNQ